MPARVLVLVTAVLAAVLGVVAELTAFDPADVHLWLPDLLVGWTLVGCGLVAAVRRPASWSGALLVATGLAWFLGNFADQLVYLHRGVLVHLLITFAAGSTTSRRQRVAVAVGYAVSLLPALWDSAVATITLSAALVGYCALDHRDAMGARRRARREALVAASALALVLVAAALGRAALSPGTIGRPSLVAYEVVLCAIALGLLAGLVTSDQERVDVTDLVVELGTERSRTLRASLSTTLGDPSLDVGYWLAEAGTYVAADGRPFAFPGAGSGRTVTYVRNDGENVAAIVHDPAVLEDLGVREAVASATRLAAVNSRLQGEVRARVTDLEASRRRVLEARDAESRRLERLLRDGAEHRLLQVAGLLRRGRRSASAHTVGERVTRAHEQVEEAMEDLARLAQGIHPRVLTESGLRSAVVALVDQHPLPVDLRVEADRLPPAVEAAAYFVCAEALANVVKHASASSVRVSVVAEAASLVVVVEDDGVGGADPDGGSGLRGLSDRVVTLGGTLRVAPALSGGTRLAAEIPLGGERSSVG